MSTGPQSPLPDGPLVFLSARYAGAGPTRRVVVETNAGTAVLDTFGQKLTLLDAGFVFLGGLAGRVPPCVFTGRNANGRPFVKTLDGFTTDARLVALYRQYAAALADGSFRPGPVAIPEA